MSSSVKPQSHIHESWRRTATNRHSWRNSPRSFWFFHIRCSSLCFGNTFVAYRQGRRGATNVLNCSKQSWLHREFLISVVYSSIFFLHRYISLDFVEGRSASVVVPVSSDCHVERRQYDAEESCDFYIIYRGRSSSFKFFALRYTIVLHLPDSLLFVLHRCTSCSFSSWFVLVRPY